MPDADDPEYVYVLRLRDGCFYVGASRTPYAAIQDHIRGRGGAWTLRHRFLKVIVIKHASAAVTLETMLAQYAHDYGADKVQ